MIVLGGAVAVEFVFAFAGAVYGTPSRTILGPASSLDTSGDGTAAFAQLLRSEDHPVRQLQTRLDAASLSLPGTLFVLDPQANLSVEVRTISRYVETGGRVVLGGRLSRTFLRELLGPGTLPAWHSTVPALFHPGAPRPENFAAREVVSDQPGSWTLSAASGPQGMTDRVLLGSSARALALIVAGQGRGSLVLLASSSPLDNASLARADNAAFGLDLAGPAGTVVFFDEYDHLETSSGSGLAGLPGHWQAALLLGLLAVVVWIVSAARRFGPPQPAERELVPARIAHVDAVAALLASGSVNRLREGADPLRRRGRDLLGRAVGTSGDAADSELEARAANLAIDPGLVTAILREPRSESDLLELGRACATLARRGRWS
jgi:hypothetical protein